MTFSSLRQIATFRRLWPALFASLLLCVKAAASDTITAADAAAHVGEHQTVCGVVASSKYADSTNRKPTFLNLDRPYPSHIFTALIWGDDRPSFKVAPEVAFRGKRICVSGTIELYKGRPEIIVRSPTAITESSAR